MLNMIWKNKVYFTGDLVYLHYPLFFYIIDTVVFYCDIEECLMDWNMVNFIIEVYSYSRFHNYEIHSIDRI